MRHDRPRWMRVVRVRLHRLLARFDRDAPVWLAWLPSWGMSLLIHGVALVLLAIVALVSGRPTSGRADFDSSFVPMADRELTTLVPADHPGDPFTEASSDRAPSVSMEPGVHLDGRPSPAPDLKFSPRVVLPERPPVGRQVDLSTPFRATATRPETPSAPFAGRLVDRAELVRREGGTTESERAVRLGLDWLMRHQRLDGGWGLDVRKQCRTPPGCPEDPPARSDTAATGLALLAFLGAGHVYTQPGPYQDQVSRGVAWLLLHQKKTGELFIGGMDDSQMYSHAIASMALCEAYGITRDPRLEVPAQLAVDFIVGSQNKVDGGWRYTPGMRGDTSVFGWQMFALRSAGLSGLNVPKNAIVGCRHYLDGAAADKDRTTYRYAEDEAPTPVMSAEALLCRQYLGWPRDHPALIKGVASVWDDLQVSQERNIYYWYYATQLLHNMQNDAWKKWNVKVREGLIATQVENKACDDGSWSPGVPQPDRWGTAGGRLFQTSLSILTLEVYYRFLPLYRGNERPSTKD